MPSSPITEKQREALRFAERVEQHTDAEVEAAIRRLAQDLARADRADGGVVESHRDNVRTVLFALTVIRARNAELGRSLRAAEDEIERSKEGSSR